jgi:hypothetical protein
MVVLNIYFPGKPLFFVPSESNAKSLVNPHGIVVVFFGLQGGKPEPG